MFVDSFREEGKYQYGLEIVRTAINNGIKCGGKTGGRNVETPNLAMKVLFGTMAPKLLENDSIGQLIAYVYKWMHVPNLEGNNQWVKNALAAFFHLKNAKVALSDKMKERNDLMLLTRYSRSMERRAPSGRSKTMK